MICEMIHRDLRLVCIDHLNSLCLRFKPCSERPLRMAEVPLVPDPVPDPSRAGHFLTYTKVKALITAGQLDPRTHIHKLPSLELKAWSQDNGLQLGISLLKKVPSVLSYNARH